MGPATTSQQALANLQQYQQGAQTPEQATSAANEALGVPSAQQQVQGLRGAITRTTDLLKNVAPSVMGRTQNSLVTSAQAGRIIGNEQAPIQDNLSKLNTDYGNANSDYQDLERQAETRANNTLSGQQNQLSYLQSIYQNLYKQEQDAAAQEEAKRQFDAQLNASRAAAAGSGGLSLGGVSGGATASSGTGGSMMKNAAGGYAFTDNSGKPVTMAQYLASNGYSGAQIIQQAAQLLSKSNGGDQGIANAIASGKYTPAQLQKLFPQVFGGAF